MYKSFLRKYFVIVFSCRYAPGNIFVNPHYPENPQYIGIDCGIVGKLNESDKRYLAESFVAFLIVIIVGLHKCT